MTAHRSYSLAFLLAACLLLGPAVAFSQDKPKKDKPKKEKKRQAEIDNNLAQLKASVENGEEETSVDIFIKGNQFFMLEEYDKALERFMAADKRDPNNAAIQYQIARTLLYMQKIDEAVPYSEKALSLQQQNAFYYTQLCDLYRRKQQYAKALGVMEKMAENKLAKEDNLMELSNLYLIVGEPKKALKVYEDMEVLYGPNDDIIRQRQRLYLRTNDKEKALEEARKLASLHPSEAEYQIELVQMLMASQRHAEAIPLLEQISAGSPAEMKYKVMLAEAYKAGGQQEKATKILEETMGNAELDFGYKADALQALLAKAYLNEADRKTAMQLSKMAVKAHPNVARAHTLYADVLMSGREEANRAEARDHYLKAVMIDGNSYAAWVQLNSHNWNLKQYDSMAKHIDMATEYFPNQASLYIQKGVALGMTNRLDEAQEAYEKAKMLSSANPAMVAQVNAYLGDLYHKKREYAKSDAAYEAVLAYEPDNMHALNNYSYYLCLRKEKLDVARKMSSRLVNLDPDSDTYLDTYGWVLYVSGEYEQAKKYLEKAAQKTQSGTVVEHYGDVLYKLGEKEQAIQQWKKAKEIGGTENPQLLERKLQEGKLLE